MRGSRGESIGGMDVQRVKLGDGCTAGRHASILQPHDGLLQGSSFASLRGRTRTIIAMRDKKT